jgi:hypothetical protein
MPTPAHIWKAHNPEKAKAISKRANAKHRDRCRRLRAALAAITETVETSTGEAA